MFAMKFFFHFALTKTMHENIPEDGLRINLLKVRIYISSKKECF